MRHRLSRCQRYLRVAFFNTAYTSLISSPR
nr:MAG TPA: hypothetical protein [Caudoviricetes sp.]